MALSGIKIVSDNVFIGWVRATGFLNAISTKYAPGVALGVGAVQVPVITPGAAKTWDASKGYEFDDANTSLKTVTFSSPEYVPTSWPSLQHSQELFLTPKLQAKFEQDGYTLGNKVFKSVEAKWKAVSGLQTAASVTKSAFDSDDVADMLQKIIETEGNPSAWSIVLDDSLYIKLVKEVGVFNKAGESGEKILFGGELKRLFGINIFPAAIANTADNKIGYLVHVGSTAFGSQVVTPSLASEANKVRTSSILPSRDGINLEHLQWYDQDKEVGREVLRVWCGAEVVNPSGIFAITDSAWTAPTTQG